MACDAQACVCLLMSGCSETAREVEAQADDAPAQHAPAGFADRSGAPMGGDSLPPAALARAFSSLGVDGIRVDLIDEAADALLLVRIGLDAFEPKLIGGQAGGVTAAEALTRAQVVIGKRVRIGNQLAFAGGTVADRW